MHHSTKIVIIFLLLTSHLQISSCFQDIVMSKKNTVALIGEININTTQKFLLDFFQLPEKEHAIIYFDTPGGNVFDGLRILNSIVPFNLTCVAFRAYSMGFTLFQACHYRYILPFSSLMQHQMHYGIVNEKMKLESYVRYVDNIDDVLSTMQAKKIGMSSEIFKKKTMNDWWLFGQDILCNNCADEIINVHCDYDKSSSVKNRHVISNCPLLPFPIRLV